MVQVLEELNHDRWVPQHYLEGFKCYYYFIQFETHFSFRFNEPIPTSRLPIFAFLTIDSPGEIWAFIDNQLVIDKGGIGFSENPYGEHQIFGNDILIILLIFSVVKIIHTW
ncbi:hypothetical protein ACTFIR_006811 [Dictyostelium discoideum]